MKRFLYIILALATFSTAQGHGKAACINKPIAPVSFSEVSISDKFWSPRLDLYKAVTIEVCIDQIENRTGCIRSFENAARRIGGFSGDDSVVYKAVEGMAYSLQNNPNSILEAKCDEWIDKVAAAQLEDGYINTYFILTGLENRWSDMSAHEMYTIGHLLEAAVAYYNVTGKRKLLDIAIKAADHMLTMFGPDKRHWVPGHEEIELALVKLYGTTGEKKYLDFAQWLLEERGHSYGIWPDWAGKAYFQDDKPVREMTDIAGHAVRAMYLYCGIADVAAYTGDKGYMDALDRLWDDVVLRNMYITGGIGQSAHNEGFTEDFSLPNLSAYCETCASVGMVLWNWRMNQFTADAKYIDVLERSLYNGALAGISLSGDRFFYVNPLESLGNHHRQAWYGTACCPSQICRFLPSVGNYIYGVADDGIFVNLYMGNTASLKLGRRDITLTQETNYPWDGNVAVTVDCKRPFKSALRLRVPGWCKSYTLHVNGKNVDARIENGYAVIERRWRKGDRIVLDMDMPATLVAADPRVKEDEGLRAVQRGPLVYCMEEVDNPGSYDSVRLTENASFSETWESDLLRGVITLTTDSDGQCIKLIPYYAWDNRDPGKMKVWLPLAD